jgi:hypothetical protein
MPARRVVTNRLIEAIAVMTVSAGGAAAAHGDPPITIHEITTGHDWGYRCGVKQPLGAYKAGLSIHQLSKSNFPPGTEGNPDYVFWVNEIAGTFGVSQRPTGEFEGFVTNPGGMVSFSADGTIWYAYGARAQDLPIDLYASSLPYDPSSFVKRLDDLDLFTGSTTPCINVDDPKLMFFWRHANSGNLDTAVRFRRYDINGTFAAPELELELGHSMEHELHGLIGIEQLWTRHDPRFGHTFLTWQFFKTQNQRFGSNPFLYSDDDGDTWRTADGVAWTQWPIRYADITDVLVPFDHITPTASTGWLVNDLGVSPQGTFWITLPNTLSGVVQFWRFDGAAWSSRTLALINECKPHACGVTRDDIIFVYSHVNTPNVLRSRLSTDDGVTWSDPVTLDVLDETLNISWVSFVQPADGYPDNAARFFYGYARAEDEVLGLRYQNNIRWIRFDPDALIPGDIDRDGVVGIQDFLILLAAWGACPDCETPLGCPADIDGDCTVGVLDFLELLAHWN